MTLSVSGTMTAHEVKSGELSLFIFGQSAKWPDGSIFSLRFVPESIITYHLIRSSMCTPANSLSLLLATQQSLPPRLIGDDDIVIRSLEQIVGNFNEAFDKTLLL